MRTFLSIETQEKTFLLTVHLNMLTEEHIGSHFLQVSLRKGNRTTTKPWEIVILSSRTSELDDWEVDDKTLEDAQPSLLPKPMSGLPFRSRFDEVKINQDFKVS
mmetsp:Transcript_35394/g.54171  ORF Transcript_35394/g.54171 Transcript_35394/m.54171 type:complete len:104 (-) Transcript_35394:1375-1686(-)